MAASRGGTEVSYLSLHLLITNLEGDGISSLKLDACSYVTITTLNACLCVCMSVHELHVRCTRNMCIEGVYNHGDVEYIITFFEALLCPKPVYMEYARTCTHTSYTYTYHQIYHRSLAYIHK